MMRMSTKSTYAVRALIDLIQHSEGKPVRLADIARRQGIPLPFLEQIFLKLKKAGIVTAIRGPQGGYTTEKSPKEVSLADIVTILEGPLEPVLCSHPENLSATCHKVEGCLSRVLCNELDGQLLKVLAKNTLAKLSGDAQKFAALNGPIQLS